MKTLQEIYDTHKQRVSEEMASYVAELENHIKELGLNKRVIRIKDGREGELKVIRENSTFAEIKFYPITKSGELSKNASEYFLLGFKGYALEKEYRPKSEG